MLITGYKLRQILLFSWYVHVSIPFVTHTAFIRGVRNGKQFGNTKKSALNNFPLLASKPIINTTDYLVLPQLTGPNLTIQQAQRRDPDLEYADPSFTHIRIGLYRMYLCRSPV